MFWKQIIESGDCLLVNWDASIASGLVKILTFKSDLFVLGLYRVYPGIMHKMNLLFIDF